MAGDFRLDLRQVAAQEFITHNVITGLQRVELQRYEEMMLDRIVYRLNAYVMAEHLADAEHTFTFQWLDGAWQRFKAKHLPTFLRWRIVRPLKYHTEAKTVEVRSWATFPESTLRVPDLGAPIYMQD